MSVTLIPDTAPFSSEQRAWLNGFLAGWTGIEEPINGHAHSNGNGHALEAISQLSPLAESLDHESPEEEDFPWHVESLSMDERLALAEGKPFKRRLMAAMAQLDCGACGYLCKTYSEAIASGEEKSLTLCSPGGKETAKMLKKLVKEEGSSAETSSIPEASAEGAKTGYSRNNPFPAKVKQLQNLNGPGSAKQTTHVEIELSGSALTYRVGDALGVYPRNCDELVNEIISRISLDRSNGAAEKLREELLEQYDLCEVTEEFVELLIGVSPDEDEKEKLQKLLKEDEYDDFDIVDMLDLAPSTKLDPGQLVAQLSPMKPRLYSIASSLQMHPDEVHLTIGKVTSELRGRERKGVASTMFADRIKPGDTVRVFIHQASDFTIPQDLEAPMIMVGPGSGIAPFRAFLEERLATGATGKNWLFFGDQRSTTDFLYAADLEAMQQKGILTRLDTAFSRDQEEKIYVQHRMLEKGRELYQWLEEGAYFFVCGDARRMAVDVDQALHEIIHIHGDLSAYEAAEYVKRLKESKRYVRDVY